MEPAKSIARLGFRRWYERQLIESHAYLVTGFLCLILVLAGIEAFNIHAAGLESLMMLVLILGGGYVGLFSWRRYLATLGRAEHLAAHATCDKCSTHAAITVTGSGEDRDLVSDTEDSPTASWLAVKCRKCGHHWTIH